MEKENAKQKPLVHLHLCFFSLFVCVCVCAGTIVWLRLAFLLTCVWVSFTLSMLGLRVLCDCDERFMEGGGKPVVVKHRYRIHTETHTKREKGDANVSDAGVTVPV